MTRPAGRSAKRDRDLLQEIHGVLHPGFHAGLDVGVTAFLGRMLDEDGEGRTSVAPR